MADNDDSEEVVNARKPKGIMHEMFAEPFEIDGIIIDTIVSEPTTTANQDLPPGEDVEEVELFWDDEHTEGTAASDDTTGNSVAEQA